MISDNAMLLDAIRRHPSEGGDVGDSWSYVTSYTYNLAVNKRFSHY